MNCVWPMAPAQEPSISAADMVLLEDLEGHEKLVPEEVAPIAREGQGRERPHDVDRAREGAEIGLHAPDAEHDRLRHPVGPLDRIEGLRPLARRSVAPARDAGRRPRRRCTPRSDARTRTASGQRDDLRIGRHAAEGLVEGRARDAARPARRPKPLDEALEFRPAPRPCACTAATRPSAPARSMRMRSTRAAGCNAAARDDRSGHALSPIRAGAAPRRIKRHNHG